MVGPVKADGAFDDDPAPPLAQGVEWAEPFAPVPDGPAAPFAPTPRVGKAAEEVSGMAEPGTYR